MPTTYVNGKSLYYTIQGPAQGVPAETVILIHGLGSSSSYFMPTVPYLSSNIRCISIDTAGSGLSCLAEPELTIDTIVEDIVHLLGKLQIDSLVIVVGHSMGGIVASSLAVKYENKVKGVVLIGPVNPSDKITEAFNKRIESVKQDGVEGLAESIPRAATGKLSTALHHSFIRNLILMTSPKGYISSCRVISAAKPPNYGAIAAPVLLIAGSDDKTAPMEGCEEILNSYGTTNDLKFMKVLEGVGHWHCIEAGELVAKHINDFLSRDIFKQPVAE